MLHTSTYLPAVMAFTVNDLVSPGLRAGSPVSPTLADSSTLSASVFPTANWSNAVSVFSTTTSWSIVPVFLTVNVTSPAAADAGVAVRVMGPSVPFVSPTITLTVAPDDAGTATPPAAVDVFDVEDE